jgi:hypothetical protein
MPSSSKMSRSVVVGGNMFHDIPDQCLTPEESDSLADWFNNGLRDKMAEFGKDETDKHRLVSELIARVIYEGERSIADVRL